MATVDVLVPTFNRSAMLRRCLESIRTQTYRDIRVSIGDNCSDDDTGNVAQDFSGRDGRFSYVRNATNLGSIGNMNALFARVSAPYVHFMHDDDWLEPSFYECLVAALEESPEAGLVWPRVLRSKGGKETAVGLPDQLHANEMPRGETAFRELLHGDFIHFPSVILRASALREAGPFAECLNADWLMWLRISLRHDLKYVDTPLFHYTLHEGQESADVSRLIRDMIDMLSSAAGLDEFAGWQSEIADARCEMACRELLRLTEERHASRLIRNWSSYCLTHVPDHYAAIRRVEMIALALTLVPPWLRPRRSGRVTHWLRRLIILGSGRQ